MQREEDLGPRFTQEELDDEVLFLRRYVWNICDDYLFAVKVEAKALEGPEYAEGSIQIDIRHTGDIRGIPHHAFKHAYEGVEEMFHDLSYERDESKCKDGIDPLDWHPFATWVVFPLTVRDRRGRR
jgi:hypothetical protein